MTDYYFNDMWRMDWGLGNPNKTAALIVTLMIAVWAFTYIKRWGFWAALGLFLGLGVCLVHTFSRGGMVALAVGLLPLMYWAPRPWPWRRLLALGASLWILVGCVVYWQAHERMTQGIVTEDRSISNRFDLWQAAPAMMVDAPGGWGWNQAGPIYGDWYQSIDITQRYKNLVNSHLTWMTEFGWPFRLFYVFAWGAVLLLCWPDAAHRWRAIPLGIWLSFFVAALFSSVGEALIIWTAPLLSLAAVLIQRLRQVQWPKPVLWALPAGTAAAVCLVFLILGQNQRALYGSPEVITLGTDEPNTWLLVDRQVLGKFYSKSLRRFRESPDGQAPSLGIALQPQALPDLEGKALFIAGQSSDDFDDALAAKMRQAERVVLLSPKFFPQQTELTCEQLKRVQAFIGEFSRSPASHAWKQAADFQHIPGVGDFLPDWPQLLFTPTPSET